MLCWFCLPNFVFSGINEQNRKVCVLCNLKPVAMRGIKSHAMVLAASNEDHTKVKNPIPTALYLAFMCSQVDMASQKIR
jgi:tRNA-binding EMAP/Myf-like protein